MAEDAAIVAKAREVAEVLRREKLAELAAKKRAMVVETAQVDATASVQREMELVVNMEEELRTKRRKVAHALEKTFVPAGDPADTATLREQLAEARKRDVARACPSGRKCKVACAAPHNIAKKAKRPKEWEPKIQKEDTDEEDGDYSTESE